MNVLETLVKIANKCDEKGLFKEASEVDSIMESLSDDMRPMGQPFKLPSGKVVQRYIDKDGHAHLKPVEEEQSWTDWAKEKMFGKPEEKVEEPLKQKGPFDIITDTINEGTERIKAPE